MESKINTTLLQKLFINPEPLSRKRGIYKSLYHKIFPCDKVFQDFLSTVNNSEQRARAEYIVQRLCFEADFPPPFSLLDNLADFETSTKNRSYNTLYIPQDHYCHIVYMYLLGIYIFFYDPSINIALTKEFLRKRAEKNFDLAKDATEDFIEYWKYFCLFHDLAYPIEQLCKPESEDDESKYLECFNKLLNCLSREILAECVARFLVLWQMINDYENNALFNTVYDSPINGMLLNWTVDEHHYDGKYINDLFGDYRAIDKIHCYDHLKMLTGFVQAKDYIVVLFDAPKMQPIAIKSMTENGIHYYFLESNQITISNSSAREYLDSENILSTNDFNLRYFFKLDEDSLRLFYLNDGSGDFFNAETYRAIINLISKTTNNQPVKNIQFDAVTTSSDLNTYIFQTYQSILIYINSLVPPTDELPKQSTHLKIANNREKIASFIDDNFISIFKSIVLSQLPFSDFNAAKKALDSINLGTGNDEIRNVVGKAVDDLFQEDKITEYKNETKTELSSALINKIENEKAGNSSLIEFIYQCKRIVFNDMVVPQQEVFETKEVKIPELFEMASREDFGKKRLEGLETCIKEKFRTFLPGEEISLIDFVRRYERPKAYKYDHGIYGSLIFLLSLQYYDLLISHLFDSNKTGDEKPTVEDIMSTLCWSVDRSHYENRLKNDKIDIIDAVLRSIFFHNLYPSVLKTRYGSTNEWYYDFLKEPSTYFAMMVDSLQVWNRTKYYELSYVNWWPSFSSDDYDIIVQNNMITLRVMDYGNNIGLHENNFIKAIEQYLKGFSYYVTLDIKHSKGE